MWSLRKQVVGGGNGDKKEMWREEIFFKSRTHAVGSLPPTISPPPHPFNTLVDEVFYVLLKRLALALLALEQKRVVYSRHRNGDVGSVRVIGSIRVTRGIRVIRCV